MRRAPALVGACLALPLLLAGCGQKGPLYLPEKNAGAIVTGPAPSSAPAGAPAATAPSAPQSGAPANAAPKKNDKDDDSRQPQQQPQPQSK